MKATYATLAVVLVLAALLVPAARLDAQATLPLPVLVEEGRLSGDGNTKLPSVATGVGRVYVTWTTEKDVSEVDRPERQGSFGLESLGRTNGDPTYRNSSVAVGRDGTEHVVWISDGNAIRYRRKPFNQPWSGEVVISRGFGFANGVDIAVQGSDRIFVVVRTGEPEDGSLWFVYSTNGGQSWSPTIPVASGVSYRFFGRIAADPNGGPVMIAFTGRYNTSIYVGEWNGQNFTISCVSCARFGGRTNLFDPAIAITPAGTPYVIWRDINSDGGIYYAERQPNGSWGVSRVWAFPTDYVNSVAIAADAANNVHMAWIEGGATWYLVRNRKGELSTAIRVARPNGDLGGFRSGVDIAATALYDRSVAHIVWESFAGSQHIRYARVETEKIGCGGELVQTAGIAAPREILTPQVVPQAELDAQQAALEQAALEAAQNGARLYLPLVLNQPSFCS